MSRASASPPTGQSEAASLAERHRLRRMGARLSLGAYLTELWGRRDFLITIPLSDLRAQNQNTVLGSTWHVLNPLLLAGVYYLVFGVILGARRGIANYPAFLVTGIMTFHFTQKCIMSGARTVVSNIRLIQSLSFPRALLPVSSTITETLAHGPSLVALMVLVVITTGSWPTASWLWLVPIAGLQALLGLGLAFITSRLTFHFRDTAQFLPYVLRIWMYLSGVFFAADFVPAGWPRLLFSINPMFLFITLNRSALIPPDPDAVEPWTTPEMWAMATVWTLVALVVGFFFFRAREMEYGNAS